MTKEQPPPGYPALLKEIRDRIHSAQLRVSFAVSRELVVLYWSIGREILRRQDVEGWGAKVIDRLAKDLGVEFPGVEGFSPRNLKYMRSLAEAWPDAEIVPQLVALLPWGHLRVLLDRLKDAVRFHCRSLRQPAALVLTRSLNRVIVTCDRPSPSICF